MDINQDSFFLTTSAEVNGSKFKNPSQMKEKVQEAVILAKADKHCIIQPSRDGQRLFIKGDIRVLLNVLLTLESNESHYRDSRSNFSESGKNSAYRNSNASSNKFGAEKSPTSTNRGPYDKRYAENERLYENVPTSPRDFSASSPVRDEPRYVNGADMSRNGNVGQSTRELVNPASGAENLRHPVQEVGVDALAMEERSRIPEAVPEPRTASGTAGENDYDGEDDDDDAGPRWRGSKPTEITSSMAGTSSSKLDAGAKEFQPQRSPIKEPDSSSRTRQRSSAYTTQYNSTEPQNVTFKHTLPKTKTQIFVYSKDITSLGVDCVVNAANGGLLHGGGVAGAIAAKAGYKLKKECEDHIKQHGRLHAGQVVTTTGGNMSTYVIHSIGPAWYDYQGNRQACVQHLHEAFSNSFKEATRLGIFSIAVPAISSGIFAVPQPIVVNVMWDAIMEYDTNTAQGGVLKEIHLVNITEDITSAIAKTFADKVQNKIGAFQWNPEQYYTTRPSYQPTMPYSSVVSGGSGGGRGEEWNRGGGGGGGGGGRGGGHQYWNEGAATGWDRGRGSTSVGSGSMFYYTLY